MRRNERRQRFEVFADRDESGIRGHIAVETPGVEHLRDQANVRERHLRAETVPAVAGRTSGELLEGAETFPDPVCVPTLNRGVILAELAAQVVQDAKIVE